MEAQLSDLVIILSIWIMRELLGYLTQGKKMNALVKKNSEHIENVEKLLNDVMTKKIEDLEEGYIIEK